MEWKDKGTETILAGVIAFIGSVFLKIAKKNFVPIKTNFKNIGEIGKIKTDSHYNNELIKAFMQLSPNPMYLMDLQGSMETVNTAWCEKTEFRDPEDATGNGWLRAIPDEELEKMKRKNEAFMEHPSNVEGTQIMMGIYSNIPFKAHFKTVLLKDENEKPYKVLGILEIIKT
jgi:PAS domain-containing protein